jgi:hypothetical protein
MYNGCSLCGCFHLAIRFLGGAKSVRSSAALRYRIFGECDILASSFDMEGIHGLVATRRSSRDNIGAPRGAVCVANHSAVCLPEGFIASSALKSTAILRRAACSPLQGVVWTLADFPLLVYHVQA